VRSNEVPQDPSFLEGHKRGAYAVGPDGKYTVVATSGWSAETEATAVALAAADAQIERAWAAVKAGKKSPLYYHLAAKQLTLGLCAAYAGTFRIVVWWHCRPQAFARLSEAWINRYARALRVRAANLKVVPEKPEKWT
jgi:hypothetical protein